MSDFLTIVSGSFTFFPNHFIMKIKHIEVEKKMHSEQPCTQQVGCSIIILLYKALTFWGVRGKIYIELNVKSSNKSGIVTCHLP